MLSADCDIIAEQNLGTQRLQQLYIDRTAFDCQSAEQFFHDIQPMCLDLVAGKGTYNTHIPLL